MPAPTPRIYVVIVKLIAYFELEMNSRIAKSIIHDKTALNQMIN